ncbi:hypothetical protein V4E86_14430 [Burkholderia pseudomallei]
MNSFTQRGRQNEPMWIRWYSHLPFVAQRLPSSEFIIYPDSGHSAVFLFHADFVPKALEFLSR